MSTIYAENVRRLFHYTTLSRFLRIIVDGEIKPATLYIDRGEKAAVWFSLRQDWEPTATPGWEINGAVKQITFAELIDIEMPARIEITPAAAPLDWRAWRRLSGARSKIVKALEEVALRKGSSISDWRMSFDPVMRNDGHWLAAEVFSEGHWQNAFDVLQKSMPG